MNKNTILTAFATQKGGIGKTTFTVITASILHYLKGYNIAIIDCDFPQHSVNTIRKRDIELIKNDTYFKTLAYNQFSRLNKNAYPVICCKPESAFETIDRVKKGGDYDVILIDIPGTVNSSGVLNALSAVDYIFTPITADRIVLESCLSFANVITKTMINQKLYLFWNMVDAREKTDLFNIYNKVIGDLGLNLIYTIIPDIKRIKREISTERKTVFRSTIFPPSRSLLKGSGIEELTAEICKITGL